MIVLDTNVVSELMRPAPSPVVVDWIRSLAAGEACTTAVTVAEIRYGLARLPEGERRRTLTAVADGIFDEFRDQILPFDVGAAACYALVVSGRERAGAPIDGFDAQIAAVCRSRRATLATRNVRDFLNTGIDVLDPWRS